MTLRMSIETIGTAMLTALLFIVVDWLWPDGAPVTTMITGAIVYAYSYLLGRRDECRHQLRATIQRYEYERD